MIYVCRILIESTAGTFIVVIIVSKHVETMRHTTCIYWDMSITGVFSYNSERQNPTNTVWVPLAKLTSFDCFTSRTVWPCLTPFQVIPCGALIYWDFAMCTTDQTTSNMTWHGRNHPQYRGGAWPKAGLPPDMVDMFAIRLCLVILCKQTCSLCNLDRLVCCCVSSRISRSSPASWWRTRSPSTPSSLQLPTNQIVAKSSFCDLINKQPCA